MKDDSLWQRIIDFHFDEPVTAYGFSARIAAENSWTANFTKHAVLEYKKFMYLAATSGMMVSPSEIVDAVWHEHLIFTESYNAFCEILGKRIEHIPSTHSRAEFEKFKRAKTQTTKAYEKEFGKQPQQFWDYPDMHAQLHLKKSKIKISILTLSGILVLIALLFPAYSLLKPLYIHVGNPDFLIGYTILFGICLYFLQTYSRSRINGFVSGLPGDSFIFDLIPDELLYLQHAKMPNVIHNKLNEMIKADKVEILGNAQLKLRKGFLPKDNVEFTIAEAIKHMGKTHYDILLGHLHERPALMGIITSMHELRRYFMRSVFFVRLYALNFCVFAVVFLLGSVRICTGIQRGKPVLEIGFFVIIVIIVAAAFLLRLTNIFTRTILPNHYKEQIIPKLPEENAADWQYFLVRNAALAVSFLPLMSEARVRGDSVGSRNSGWNSCGSGGSSCSSGGSSCGNSCGGCGGD